MRYSFLLINNFLFISLFSYVNLSSFEVSCSSDLNATREISKLLQSPSFEKKTIEISLLILRNTETINQIKCNILENQGISLESFALIKFSDIKNSQRLFSFNR